MYGTDDIRLLAERYANARGIALSTLARLAVRNSTVFDRLDRGRVTVRTLRDLVSYLSDRWPEGLEWPSDIPRPAPGAKGKAA